MEWLYFSLFIATANCLQVNNDEYTEQKIVGGRYVSIREVPYQAQVISDDDTICGAAIISEYWLLSAAHCFVGSENGSLSITTGSSRSFSGIKHEIEKCIIHPAYNQFSPHDNDISVIKLKNPIKWNKNQYWIPLATKAPKTGDIMKISGYGWESLRKKRAMQRLLKAANVKVTDQAVCVSRYAELFSTVTANSFCAGGPNNAGSCTADSGSPGVIAGELSGLVSGGYECNTRHYPGIYTRVHRYRDWVIHQTGLTTTG